MRNKVVLLCAALAVLSVGCKKKSGPGGGGGWFVGEEGLMVDVDPDGRIGDGYDLGAAERLEAIACRYLDEAWVAGSNGTLLYTSDAGATWQAHDVGVGAAHLRGLATQDGGPVFIAGDGVLATAVPREHDGAATWTNLADGATRFVGVAAAQQGATVLAVSDDGGVWAYAGGRLDRRATLAGARGVAVSPDGAHAIVAGDGLAQPRRRAHVGGDRRRARAVPRRARRGLGRGRRGRRRRRGRARRRRGPRGAPDRRRVRSADAPPAARRRQLQRHRLRGGRRRPGVGDARRRLDLGLGPERGTDGAGRRRDRLRPQLSGVSTDALVGRVLAQRYRLEARLGAGAMGAVYRARHVKLARAFAVKVLLPDLLADAKLRQRFVREAEVAGTLRHRNVVGVIDVGETDDGVHYLVMELADGPSLGHLLGAPLPPARAIALIKQLCDGLAHAHERGLIHRDFKPDNVIVETDRDGRETPRIVDFGIALLKDEASPEARARLTTAGMILGTPQYMAPEHATGRDLDHRIDLFALGIVVYEMLTGVLPFDGDGVEVARANLLEPTPPMAARAPGVPVDPLLEAFTRRLMAKSRDERPPTAKAARALLDLIVRDRAAAAAQLGVADPMEATPALPARSPAPAMPAPPAMPIFPTPLPSFAALAAPTPRADAARPITEPPVAAPPRRRWTPIVLGALAALAAGGLLAVILN